VWSLPNIATLNARAEAEYRERKDKPETSVLEGKECEHHDCTAPAERLEDYYDIFGDKDVPKGFIPLCGEHSPDDETYFWCEGCSRYHVINYTWEIYRHIDEDGYEKCLRCHFEEELENEENWITDPEELTFERLRKAKHLIAVGTKYHEEKLVEIGSVTLDSYSGEEVVGFTSTSGSRESGPNALKKAARAAILQTFKNTHKKHKDCIIILDGAYQFAVSIGVYARKGE